MDFLDRLKQLLGGDGPAGQASARSGGREEVLDERSTSECRSITCMEALEKIHEFLDGELSEVSRREVAHHFSICKRCYPHLRLEERFREALRSSQEDEVCPDHLKSRVLDLLAKETRE